eukprot:UN16039
MNVSRKYLRLSNLVSQKSRRFQKCLRDMKIPNIVSKTFTSPPITLKMFRPEISVMVEIST